MNTAIYRREERSRGWSLGSVLGVATLALVAFVGVAMLPDLMRYIKIRNM